MISDLIDSKVRLILFACNKLCCLLRDNKCYSRDSKRKHIVILVQAAPPVVY